MVRLLRIAAAASAFVAVAAVVVPFVLLWWADDPPSDLANGPGLFANYFVQLPAIAGVLVIAGIVALVLVALARILDRLDDVEGRMNRDD